MSNMFVLNPWLFYLVIGKEKEKEKNKLLKKQFLRKSKKWMSFYFIFYKKKIRFSLSNLLLCSIPIKVPVMFVYNSTLVASANHDIWPYDWPYLFHITVFWFSGLDDLRPMTPYIISVYNEPIKMYLFSIKL